MKKVAVLVIVLSLLLCACESNVGETIPPATTADTQIITACADNLTAQERQALTDYLHSTRIHLTEIATLDTVAKWNCRLNEKCQLAVACWDIERETGFQPVLIYDENGQLCTEALGMNSATIFDSSPFYGSVGVNMSFIQQVGETTIICIDSFDLEIREKPYDSVGTTPLKLSYEEACPITQGTWLRSSTDPMSDEIYSCDRAVTGEYSYLFAVTDLEDNYTLYIGGEQFTGTYLKTLLASAKEDQSP